MIDDTSGHCHAFTTQGVGKHIALASGYTDAAAITEAQNAFQEATLI